MRDESCDACDKPWAVRFEWDYTDPEQYCERHILEPLEGQPGNTLLDYMPNCGNIGHRLTPNGRVVRYTSLAAIYPILTGRLA